MLTLQYIGCTGDVNAHADFLEGSVIVSYFRFIFLKFSFTHHRQAILTQWKLCNQEFEARFSLTDDLSLMVISVQCHFFLLTSINAFVFGCSCSVVERSLCNQDILSSSAAPAIAASNLRRRHTRYVVIASSPTLGI